MMMKVDDVMTMINLVVVVMIEIAILVHLGEVLIQIVVINTLIQTEVHRETAKASDHPFIQILNVVVIEIVIKIPVNQRIKDVHLILMISVPNRSLDIHNGKQILSSLSQSST